ncbi:sugar transferase [Eubacterium sp. AF05-24]|nr:sugar transferase [Eubacterium sp. AF05-24]
MTKTKENIKSRYGYFFIKRIFDFISALSLFIIISPIFLIIAIAIKVDSKGPVFFKHMRVGKNGKPLPTYKFRTMVTTPEQKKEYEENFKLENDPRITKIGKILRKTSLDELPQLLNIIIGNMSVVGPRPVVQKELEKFGDQVDKLLSVTPGLTGYWQANGRSNTTYEERVAMELYYVDHCSIWLDIKIIFQTIGAVIRKEGAK